MHGDTVTGGVTVVSYPSLSVQLFLKPDAEGFLRLHNVGVVGVVATRDVVEGAAQFLLQGFFRGVYEHWANSIVGLMEQVYSVGLVGPWQLPIYEKHLMK